MADGEKWYEGDLVMDANENVARRGQNGGWWILGWIDEEHADHYLTRPLRRLGPVADVPVKGKADPSLYRITYDSGAVKYGPRRVLGPVVGHALAGNSSWSKHPVKIERAVAPQFTDVTDEFL